MTAVLSARLPTQLDPTSAAFAKLSLKPIVDKEDVRKAIFETAYEPNEKWWLENQKAYVKLAEGEDDPLPEGFPESVEDASVWDGKELITKPELWLHVFTPSEVAEIEDAIAHFISLKKDFSSINKSTFPLTTLKSVFEEAVKAIHTGVGVKVFRGLPVKLWDRKSQIIAFAGISAYIGDRLRQATDSAIIHLRDLTSLDKDNRPAIVLKGQTNGNQCFHTDSGDIIGLFTLDKAAKGGLSQLSSIGSFYNALATSRRDVLRTLARPYKSGRDLEGTPVLHHVDGRVIAQYGRRAFFPFFEDQSVDANIPPLTTEQHLALDALHFTAEERSLDIDLQPGDLEFFSNLRLFHARTSSEDSEDEHRHLIRVWLRNEEHALEHGEALDERWAALKLKETKTKYLIEWSGTDPDTGKAWEPSWEPKANASATLVKKWDKSKADQHLVRKKDKGKEKEEPRSRDKGKAKAVEVPTRGGRVSRREGQRLPDAIFVEDSEDDEEDEEVAAALIPAKQAATVKQDVEHPAKRTRRSSAGTSTFLLKPAYETGTDRRWRVSTPESATPTAFVPLRSV
ncbi:hypothetical protein MNV49_001147 [Pseudohyphozyma bogoriensis]|nr:hypothetical protein MNV49_001147 [Pseudohyphozyma bogoriensis]